MLVKDVLKKKLFEISRLNKEGFKINVMTVGVHKAGLDKLVSEPVPNPTSHPSSSAVLPSK